MILAVHQFGFVGAAGAGPLPIGTVHFVSSAANELIRPSPRGSGFLVGPCYIVTAKHVAPRKRPIIGARLRFNAPGHSAGGTVIAAGDNSSAWSMGPARGGDWLLARLDRCLGDQLGWFRLSAARFTATPQFFGRGAPLAVGGFPGVRDRSAGVVVGRKCVVQAVLIDGTITSSCQADYGQSGGPMFTESLEDGRLSLVAFGIISAIDPNLAVFAAPVDEIAAQLPGLTNR